MDSDYILSEVSCSTEDARNTTVFDFERPLGEAAILATDADGDLSVARRSRGNELDARTRRLLMAFWKRGLDLSWLSCVWLALLNSTAHL